MERIHRNEDEIGLEATRNARIRSALSAKTEKCGKKNIMRN